METYVKGHWTSHKGKEVWVTGHWMMENPRVRARHIKRVHEEMEGLAESLEKRHHKRMRA